MIVDGEGVGGVPWAGVDLVTVGSEEEDVQGPGSLTGILECPSERELLSDLLNGLDRGLSESLGLESWN